MSKCWRQQDDGQGAGAALHCAVGRIREHLATIETEYMGMRAENDWLRSQLQRARRYTPVEVGAAAPQGPAVLRGLDPLQEAPAVGDAALAAAPPREGLGSDEAAGAGKKPAAKKKLVRVVRKVRRTRAWRVSGTANEDAPGTLLTLPEDSAAVKSPNSCRAVDLDGIMVLPATREADASSEARHLDSCDSQEGGGEEGGEAWGAVENGSPCSSHCNGGRWRSPAHDSASERLGFSLADSLLVEPFQSAGLLGADLLDAAALDEQANCQLEGLLQDGSAKERKRNTMVYRADAGRPSLPMFSEALSSNSKLEAYSLSGMGSFELRHRPGSLPSSLVGMAPGRLLDPGDSLEGGEMIRAYRTQVQMPSQESNFAMGFATDNARLRRASVFDESGVLVRDDGELLKMVRMFGAQSSTAARLSGWWEWYADLQPPAAKNRMARLVGNFKFEIAIVANILANAAFAVVFANAKVGKKCTACNQLAYYRGVNTFFETVFFLELICRLLAHGLWFFHGPDIWWNLLDLVIGSVCAYQHVLGMLADRGDEPSMSWTFVRLIRLVKANRLRLILNKFRALRDLSLMLQLLLQCMSPAFLWTVVSVFFIMYFIAVFMVQMAAIKLSTLSPADEQYELIYKTFGTFANALLSLFKATSGGDDWGNILDVVQDVDTKYATPCFLAFIIFFQLALFNVVTGIFVEKAMTSAELTDEEKMIKNREKELKYARELIAICKALDRDESGTIAFSEFVDFMNGQPKFRSAFAERGLTIKNPRTFFKMLASTYKADNIPLSDFVSACMRLRGEASCLDLHTLDFQVKLILTNQLKFQRHLRQEIASIKDCMSDGLAARPSRE